MAIHVPSLSAVRLRSRPRLVRSARALLFGSLALGALASGAAAAQLQLSWNDNSTNEAGFKIERSVAGGTFSQIATVGANVTSYTDSALTTGTAYSYRVRAYNSAGNSAYSNTIAYSAPTGNTAPTISSIAAQSLASGAVTGPLAFTVGDAETAAGSLIVTGSSSNQTLVPNSNLFFGGSGANRTVAVTPNAGQTGTATVTLKVSDGALSRTSTFTVTVTALSSTAPANTPPTISAIPDQTITVGGKITANFTVGDAEIPAGDLRMSKQSSNTTLIPTSNIVFGVSGAYRTVTITPVAGQTGTATITAIVRDGELTGSTSFVVTVKAAATNTAPKISAIPDQTIAVDGKATINFTVSDAESTSGDLRMSKTSSNTTLIPTSNIVFGGSDSNRTVTITPVAGQTGTATITAIVRDGELSGSTSFVVTVKAAATNTAPEISAIPDQTITVNGKATINFTVSDAESPSGDLRMSKTSSNTTLIPTSNIVFGVSGAYRTVTITPVAGKTGTATITAIVRDGVLTGSTSFVVTVKAATTNTAPTISWISNRTTTVGKATTASFTIADKQTSAGNLKLKATSSNTALIPNANLVFGGSGGSRTLKTTPVSGKTGQATITVTVSDGSLSASRKYTVTVKKSTASTDDGASSRLVNASIRGHSAAGADTLIAGFVISGDAEKAMLVRGVGPALAAFGVSQPLADPVLALYAGTSLTEINDDWSTDSEAVLAMSGQTGAFALPDASRDGVLATSLPAGGYTAQAQAKGADAGVALIELYDVNLDDDSRLTNLSGRGRVGAGDNVLIVGFELSGNGPRRILVRGVGPALEGSGISGVLRDPQLQLYQGRDLIEENDNWGGSQALTDAFSQSGAFALSDASSKDAALLVTLEPGTYTVVLSGADASTGVALIELYDVGAPEAGSTGEAR